MRLHPVLRGACTYTYISNRYMSWDRMSRTDGGIHVVYVLQGMIPLETGSRTEGRMERARFTVECCPMPATSKLMTAYNTVPLRLSFHEMGPLVEPHHVLTFVDVHVDAQGNAVEQTGWQVHVSQSIDTPGERSA